MDKNDKETGLTVLSLFDGMGCGRIALRQAGIPVAAYYASEVDRHAMAQTRLNFPDTVHLGDVRGVSARDLPPIGLLMGGSPCTDFSLAGKRRGMSTTAMEEVASLGRYMELKRDGFEFVGQSYLFWEYVRILGECREKNPDVLFLLENVEMGRERERVIDEALGIKGVHINSALVSAQNRRRIYWTNIRTRAEGLFGDLVPDIPQPADRGIMLHDILEPDVPERYYLSQKTVERMVECNRRNAALGNNFRNEPAMPSGKADCLRVGGKGAKDLVMQLNSSRKSGGKQPYQQDRFYSTNGQAPALMAGNGGKTINILCIASNQAHATVETNKSTPMVAAMGMGGGHVPMVVAAGPVIMASRGRGTECLAARRNETGKKLRGSLERGELQMPRATVQQLEPRGDGKTNALTTVQKDNLLAEPSKKADARRLENIKPPDGMAPVAIPGTFCTHKDNYGFREIKSGKGGTVLARARQDGSGQNVAMLPTGRIRRLTPAECARLQTVPDWYRWECSETQQYRMLGNGWTVEVIRHIFSFIDIDKTLNYRH